MINDHKCARKRNVTNKMAGKDENKFFFQQLTHSLQVQERRLEKVSHAHLVADHIYFKNFEQLYKEIRTGKGIPCNECGVLVTANNYGTVLYTHNSPKKLIVKCRRCGMPGYSFGI